MRFQAGRGTGMCRARAHKDVGIPGSGIPERARNLNPSPGESRNPNHSKSPKNQ